MRLNYHTWPIATFNSYRQQINPTPNYQRGSVWKLPQKQLLIDSILRKIDIPKLYLRETPRGAFQYEIIDGQQRITTLWSFLSNEFMLAESAKELLLDDGSSCDIAEMTFGDLPTNVQISRVNNFPLSVVIAENATEDEIANLFLRLNNGTPLTAPEVRHSMPGLMKQFVTDREKHPFFKAVSFADRRFAHAQVLAQLTLLELTQGPTDIGDEPLTDMYSDYKDQSPSQGLQTKFIKVLDYLAKAFPSKSRLLKKNQVVNIYLLASYLHERKRLQKIKHSDFAAWYLKSEPDRLSKHKDYKALNKSGVNRRNSILERFQILLLDLNSTFPDTSVALDPQRIFDDSQKIQIYRKDTGTCQNPACKKKVTETGWHADHVLPWIKGGKTDLANGQVLCIKCNLRKKDKLW